MTKQFSVYFNQPVDPVELNIPDYPKIVKNPMDLGTVRNKLRDKRYENILEYATDIRLVFSNAMKYNPPPHPVHGYAALLLDEFETQIRLWITEKVGEVSIEMDGVDQHLSAIMLNDPPEKHRSFFFLNNPQTLHHQHLTQERFKLENDNIVLDENDDPLQALKRGKGQESFDHAMLVSSAFAALDSATSTVNLDIDGLDHPTLSRSVSGEGEDEEDHLKRVKRKRKTKISESHLQTFSLYRCDEWWVEEDFERPELGSGALVAIMGELVKAVERLKDDLFLLHLFPRDPVTGQIIMSDVPAKNEIDYPWMIAPPKFEYEDEGEDEKKKKPGSQRTGLRNGRKVEDKDLKSGEQQQDPKNEYIYKDYREEGVPVLPSEEDRYSEWVGTPFYDRLPLPEEFVPSPKREESLHFFPTPSGGKRRFQIVSNDTSDPSSPRMLQIPSPKPRPPINSKKKKRPLSSSDFSMGEDGSSDIKKRRVEDGGSDEDNEEKDAASSIPQVSSLRGKCKPVSDDNYSISERVRELLGELERDTTDPDCLIYSPLVDVRYTFLEVAQFRHLQFDSLRRAKYSSLTLLYHLHHPYKPSLRPKCDDCGIFIQGVRWRVDPLEMNLCASCVEERYGAGIDTEENITPIRVSFI